MLNGHPKRRHIIILVCESNWKNIRFVARAAGHQDWRLRRRVAVWSYLILSLLLLLGVCEKGCSSHSRQSVRQLAATRCRCPITIPTWLYWHGEEHDLTEYC